jgi:hypothetical protein
LVTALFLNRCIRKNFSFRLTYLVVYNKYEQVADYAQKTNAYGIGFFIRKYKQLGNGFYLFGQTRAGVNYCKQDYDDKSQQNSSYISKITSAQIAIYPGLAYTVSRKGPLEASFNNLAFIQFYSIQPSANNI